MALCTVVLHNIRSLHNVGSIFRTADACAVDKIVLVGYTPTPIDRFGRKEKMIAKTALGAEETIPWEQYADIETCLNTLRKEGNRIVGVEQTPRSIDYREYASEGPTALVFGSEVEGLSKECIDACDVLIQIPMRGSKESLNVSVCAGIILAKVTEL